MKLNKDCIRDILLYIESHCVFEDSKYGRTMHTVLWTEIIKADELNKHTEDDMRYTVYMLSKYHYIDCTLIPKGTEMDFDLANIKSLTLSGHNLLDNIRPEPVWDKTKNILKQVGDFSLDIMTTVAGEVMASYTKSLMRLS